MLTVVAVEFFFLLAIDILSLAVSAGVGNSGAHSFPDETTRAGHEMDGTCSTRECGCFMAVGTAAVASGPIIILAAFIAGAQYLLQGNEQKSTGRHFRRGKRVAARASW